MKRHAPVSGIPRTAKYGTHAAFVKSFMADPPFVEEFRPTHIIGKRRANLGESIRTSDNVPKYRRIFCGPFSFRPARSSEKVTLRLPLGKRKVTGWSCGDSFDHRVCAE